MSDEPIPRRQRLPAVALTALVLAAGLPAGVALAGGAGGGDGASGSSGATQQPVQEERERPSPGPDRHDCPERDGDREQEGAATAL